VKVFPFRKRPHAKDTAKKTVTLPVVPKADRFRSKDLVVEAITGLAGHPGRLTLSALVVVLGIGALVATIGLAQTGARQLQARFDHIAATHGTVRVAEDPMTLAQLNTIPWDAGERASRLNGVIAAGTLTVLDNTDMVITASPVFDPMAPPTRKPGVIAISPGLLDAVSATLEAGTDINSFHDARGERVALLGTKAASLLGVTRVDNQPAVFIDGTSYTVIGIVQDTERAADLIDAVIIPQSTARVTLGLSEIEVVHVQVEIGAGPMIQRQIGTALSPSSPTGYDIVMPPPPSQMREQLTVDVNSLFLILGLVALLLGGVTIAVVSSLSVMERRGEIGLRRALGATRQQVAVQYITETAIVGLLGGLAGAAAGVLAVVTTAAINQWTPVLDLRLVGLAIILGVIVGAVSGLIPALRAARLEPATALQQGT